MAKWEFFGLAEIKQGLRVVADPPADPLMQDFERIITADNLRKITVEKVDKNGSPLGIPPSRSGGPTGKWSKKKQANLASQHGFSGPYASGFDQNLTSAQYRMLKGPSTAPRDKDSRVVTNLETGHGRDSEEAYGWYAEGVWFDVVSKKGFHFLSELFKRWPLDGLRPWGRSRCVDATVKFCNGLTERYFGG